MLNNQLKKDTDQAKGERSKQAKIGYKDLQVVVTFKARIFRKMVPNVIASIVVRCILVINEVKFIWRFVRMISQ